MRRRLAVLCIVACGKSAVITAAPDASAVGAVDASVTLVDAGVPDTRLFDLLTRPDKLEAFTVDTSAFSDSPVGDAGWLGGRRIVSRLGPPATPTFRSNFGAMVLSDGAYRKTEAVKCALGPAIGLRWTRGSDVAETVVMAPCPSLNIRSTLGLIRGGQLEGDMATKVFALTREAYPGH